MKISFFDSLLWRTIFPVILIGLSISIFLSHSLVPPLVSIIEKRVDKEIGHTATLAQNVCEERFRDILDLRMEDDAAMNNYSQKEALQKIKDIALTFPNIKVLVLDSRATIKGASFSDSGFNGSSLLEQLEQQEAVTASPKVIEYLGRSLRYSYAYFPFWRWHIITFTEEQEYLAPINMAKKIVYFGTFGTLFSVILTVILLYFLQINIPLKQIIAATEKVRHGNLQRVGLSGKGEIEQVAGTFDEMVQALELDNRRIDLILKELRESEEQYRVLFEQAAVGVSVSDTETGRYIRVNKKYSDIVGYSTAELLEKTFQEISYPDDLEKDIHNLHLLQDGSINEYTMDKRFLHKDGSIVWGRLTISPMKKSGEKRKYHIAILEDITRRKKLEKQFADNNALLEAVLMQSQIPIGILSAPEARTLYLNQAAISFLGMEENDYQGQSFDDIRVPSTFYFQGERELSRDELPITKALLGTKTHNEEIKVIHTDGTVRWALVTASPIYNNEGQHIAAFAVFPDITEQKRSEAAIRESEERYRLVMEACPEPIAVYDMKGRVQYVNRAFTDVFGWSSKELVGNTIPYVPEEAWPETQVMLEMVNNGENYFGFETRRLDKKGRIIDVVISWGVWRDQHGDLAGTVVVLRDVTKKKMLKKQLLQAQKMESIGSLAGGIAHDFNNILSPIIGYSQLLLKDLLPRRENYTHAKNILDSGRRASDLVKQILAFSRQSDQEMIQVNFQDVLREVARLSRSIIPKSIEIHKDIQENCGAVMANPTQLHQIVMNLITNAFHAVDETDGVISLTLKEVDLENGFAETRGLPSGLYVQLAVSDNGSGIDPTLMGRIFDPYFSTKEKGKGTGLGLSIVYGIVKEHRGDIKVYSEVGKGTTFQIYLPVIAQQNSNFPHEQKSELPKGSEHILLVDDELSVLDLVKEMLECLGYRVTAYDSSPDALKAFKKDPLIFDLVISDMTMPQMTGIHLAKEILSTQTNTPIIMCTGFGTKITTRKAEEAGIKATLMKPLLLEDLAKTIRQVLIKTKN